MTQKLLVLIIAAFFNTIYLEKIDFFSASHHDIYLYGKITTEDGDVYTGQIRWGKEEAFWFDFFNSSKTSNDFITYLSDDEMEELMSNDRDDNFVKGLFGWDSPSRNKYNTHVFQCQFGNIRSIVMERGGRIELEFKNGENEYG